MEGVCIHQERPQLGLLRTAVDVRVHEDPRDRDRPTLAADSVGPHSSHVFRSRHRLGQAHEGPAGLRCHRCVCVCVCVCCLLYTSPSPRDLDRSRMPSSA